MTNRLSENIRFQRKQKGMMQEALAEALGVSIGAVSKWERGAAVPELHYLVEMADLFGISVDALIGYQVQRSTAKDLEQRMRDLSRAKRFEEAVSEAEKALSRYPNQFQIVYTAGQTYLFKGIEQDDSQALERAIALLQRAIPLLPQSTDPDISEVSVNLEIAQCYIAMGRQEEGIALLKQFNVCGINNSLIGHTYAVSRHFPPDKAAPYLAKAFVDCFMTLVRTMIGYVNYYDRLGSDTAAADAMLWLIEYLQSIKETDDGISYVDKVMAPMYAGYAHLCDRLGRQDEAAHHLQTALKIARAFDAAPVYNVYGMRFCIGDMENATAYDDLGQTAMEAIESQIREGEWPEGLRALWRSMKESSGAGLDCRTETEAVQA